MANTVTNEKISDLPLKATAASSDQVELLTGGDNQRTTIAGLTPGLAQFVAAGGSHAAGLVPDPGGSAHASPYLLGDNGQFVQVAGAGVSYSGGVYTIPGGGIPGGSNGQIQYNNSNAFGGATLTSLIDAAFGSTRGSILYRGASGWAELTPGTNGQVLTSGGAGVDPAYAAPAGTGTVTSVATGVGLTGGPINTTGTIALNTISAGNVLANTTGGAAAPAGVTLSAAIDAGINSTRGTILYRGASAWTALAPGSNGYVLTSSGAGADPSYAAPGGTTAARTPIFSVGTAGSRVINTAAPTSLFTGSTIGPGSRTIPANRLAVGSVIAIVLWGDFDSAGNPLVFVLKLGSTTIMTGMTGNMTSTLVGKHWRTPYFNIFIQNPFADGTRACGDGRVVGFRDGVVEDWTCLMTTSGGGTASAPVVLDVTSALLIDVIVTWTAASPSNSIRLLGGACWIDG